MTVWVKTWSILLKVTKFKTRGGGAPAFGLGQVIKNKKFLGWNTDYKFSMEDKMAVEAFCGHATNYGWVAPNLVRGLSGAQFCL